MLIQIFKYGVKLTFENNFGKNTLRTHNEYGPSEIYVDKKTKKYSINGRLHNIYGPSIIEIKKNHNCDGLYFLHGWRYSFNDWKEEIKNFGKY